MGYTHYEVDPDAPYEPPSGTKNDAIAKLTELLEWERKQRAEAQARVAELERLWMTCGWSRRRSGSACEMSWHLRTRPRRVPASSEMLHWRSERARGAAAQSLRTCSTKLGHRATRH